jgi:hypothetical protein
MTSRASVSGVNLLIRGGYVTCVRIGRHFLPGDTCAGTRLAAGLPVSVHAGGPPAAAGRIRAYGWRMVTGVVLLVIFRYGE